MIGIGIGVKLEPAAIRGSGDVMAIDRRVFLQRAAWVMGAALSPGCVGAVMRQDPDAPLRTETPVLETGPKAILDRMVDRILPATETPGALETEVPAFIEFVLAEGSSAEHRQRIAQGLVDLDARAKEMHGVGFVELPDDAADALLGETEGQEFASAPPGAGISFGASAEKPFFASIKEWTVVGFLTSEQGASSLRSFSHMPGRFDGCAAVEPGQKPWMGLL